MASSRFVTDADDLRVSQCAQCKRKFATSNGCTAYPQGIPTAILLNQHDHRYPYPGDSGFLFEQEDQDG